jgi:hypothetical protein
VALAMRLDPPIDVVGVANIVSGTGMAAGLVWLFEVDQVAALERGGWGGAGRLGVEGLLAHAPRPAPRSQADLSSAGPQRPPGEKDALSALRVGARGASLSEVEHEAHTRRTLTPAARTQAV